MEFAQKPFSQFGEHFEAQPFSWKKSPAEEMAMMQITSQDSTLISDEGIQQVMNQVYPSIDTEVQNVHRILLCYEHVFFGRNADV